MMFVVFLIMLMAMLMSMLGWRRGSLSAVALCFVMAVALFLWEVYSPQYGFRMPWLQGSLLPVPIEQPVAEAMA